MGHRRTQTVTDFEMLVIDSINLMRLHLHLQLHDEIALVETESDDHNEHQTDEPTDQIIDD